MNAVRTAIILAGISLGALAAFIVVAARTVEQGEISLAEARLNFVLSEVGQTVERSLQLGLPLNDLEQVAPLLVRARESAPGILAADIANSPSNKISTVQQFSKSRCIY